MKSKVKIPTGFIHIYIGICIFFTILLFISLFLSIKYKNKNKNKTLSGIYYTLSSLSFLILLICLDIYLEINYSFGILHFVRLIIRP
jgi:hypothetical protein